MYSVKEIFKTLQGEGGQTGRAAVFCRFTGCNLWSGREEDRANSLCTFCDTDFVGTDGECGGKFADAASLRDALVRCWGDDTQHRLVVFTGGEPLLQLDEPLVHAIHEAGFEIAIETNGTIGTPASIDWICVSPKAGTDLKQKWGKELKLVYPQHDLSPADFEDLPFDYFWLQPMDGEHRLRNIRLAIEYCLNNPRWRISLQTHKLMGIP